MREETTNRLAEAIKEEFKGECKVHLKDVVKNNGVVLKSVTIMEPGVTVMPTVYIDEMLSRIESGDISVEDAARQIVSIHTENKGNFDDVVNRISRESILDRVTYQLINAEKNKDRLANLPHRTFCDLAVVYRVIVSEGSEETASFMVRKDMAENYGLTEDELDVAARKNTKKQKFTALTMAEVLAEMTGGTEEDMKLPFQMWILSNKNRLNGTTVMLYPENFKKLADRIESNLYVLPSSIHEVIAIPAGGEDTDMLKEMVRTVNSSEVSAEEVLSENVYRYSRNDNKFMIV